MVVETWDCIYTNSQSLRNKLPELCHFIAQSKPMLIGITETWAHSGISDAELEIKGMTILRKDRMEGTGGGCALYISTKLKAVQSTDATLDRVPEGVWATITLTGRRTCLVGVIYRPPNCAATTNTAIIEALKHVGTLRYDHVLIMGDFNLPEISFNRMSCHAGPGSTQSAFFDALLGLGWFEHVRQPTRWRGTSTPSALDWILTNEPHMVDQLTVSVPLGLGDHGVISFKFVHTTALTREEGATRWNMRRAEFSAMKDFLAEAPWPRDQTCVDAHWNRVKEVLNEAMHRFVPRTPIRISRNKARLRSRTIKSLRKKRAAWDRFILSQDSQDYQAYINIRNTCNEQRKQDTAEYQKRFLDKIVTDPKAFYRHLASATQAKPGIADVRRGDGSLTDSNTEAANTLAEYYSTVFIPTRPEPRSNRSLCDQTLDSSSQMEPVVFTPSQVQRKLDTLKTNKSPGLDEVPPLMLQQCAVQLAVPLCNLFNHSMRVGKVPTEWKTYVVSPIFKSGNRTAPQNYRPVALLSVVSKVMESLIDDVMCDFAERGGRLHDAQHGFRGKRSCQTNLIEATDRYTRAIDTGVQLDVIFLDFSKAFDRVNHPILLGKLEDLGVHRSLIEWISDYLTGRSFQVRVNGALSGKFGASSGVPQGSILGPRLFTLFVNDLPSQVQSHILLYADDVKICREIRSTQDIDALQADLEELFQWSARNCLPFNIEKCKVMHFGGNQMTAYSLGGCLLQSVSREKDLGTVFTEDLSQLTNCNTLASRATFRLNQLSRVLGKFTPEAFPKIFATLIRPYIEVNIQACPPTLRRDINTLERVQRRATKRVAGLANMEYTDRLRSLNLYSMEYRRARGDLILLRDILISDGHPNRHLFQAASTATLRGNSLKLERQRPRLRVRENCFPVRVCRPWNSLPDTVILASNKQAFKRQLDQHVAQQYPGAPFEIPFTAFAALQ